MERTDGLPWKEIQGFGGGSDAAGAMLYCTVTSKLENGVLRGGVYRSRDRGQTWQSAMGHGINVDKTKADQWSYGPIAQYKQVLATDARPLTVYVMNTSTGFHPPHHETVYRSDDGGDTWRATFFQDPRFQEYNVAPNYVTASAGQSYKGGDTPFGAAICNSDPNRLILVWSQSYITHNGGDTWFNGDTYPAPGQQPKPGSAWVCTGLVVTTTWNYYIDPFETNRHYIAYTDIGLARSIDSGKTWTLKKNGLGHPLNMRVSRVILHKDGTLFAMICAMRPAQGKPLMSEGVIHIGFPSSKKDLPRPKRFHAMEVRCFGCELSVSTD